MAAPILGDLLYRAASLWTRLAGNTTSTRKFLSQTGTGSASAVPAWNQVADADLSVTDITTNNVTISAHGFAPKAPNDATKFLNGVGGYTVPGGSGGTVTTTGSPANGNLTKFSGAASITNADLTGDVTTSGTVATTIANSAVTLAKIANAAASSKLVGSGASGSGAAYSELTLGTNLSMSGTTLNATGGSAGALILLEQHTASSSATLDFTTAISSTYDTYMITLINVIPATDAANLLMTVSTDGGSTFSSTTYRWSYNYILLGSGTGGGVNGGTSDSSFHLSNANKNTTGLGGTSGRVFFYNPGNASANKVMEYDVIQWNSGDTLPYKYYGSGAWSNTTAINALRFSFSSGNIASGTIRVYGIAK